MIKCPICESDTVKFKLEKSQYNINKCSNCEAEFVYPQPEESELIEVYEDHEYHSKDRYNINQKIERFNPIWMQRLKHIFSLGYKGGSLLDIGCATGIFLKIAHKNGWEVTGLEKSQNAADIAAEYLGKDNIFNTDLMDFSPIMKFDVVTLWALIEHVRNPMIYFKKIHELLQPNGLVGLSTPNVGSLSRFMLNKHWRYYIPPEHIIYFNKKSLAVLFELTGFKIVKIKTHFKHIAFFKRNSESLRLYQTNKLFRVLFKIILIPIEVTCKIFHLGETIEIYAIKK